ncbi:molecular chaperone [Pseudomonas aeruginosa]|uniref:fimbrial biogenesis chaperone n=1 Tax=Pseudomonas aeruginosa TaxID=287 RepID=UPI000E6802A4|nr:molecular chaperone [Pseudomonas aeruginosa]RIZ49230.1 molecular chaperone [Pseudomonas aeruginosa]
MSSRRALALLAMLCLAPASEAGVTAERTRLVFVEGQREASLLLVNQNPYPVLVQVWVDDGALDGEPDTAQAPFLPLPPVFRLEPGRQRSLRLLATGQAQAGDRESLYWLNIYEIPPQATAEAAGRPRLTVTLRTQMKVLYRPHGLHPHAEDAVAELGFALRDETLRVDNPTPYFVSLAGLAVEVGGKRAELPGTLLAPRSQRRLGLPGHVDEGTRGEVAFDWIDDNGVSRRERKALQ